MSTSTQIIQNQKIKVIQYKKPKPQKNTKNSITIPHVNEQNLLRTGVSPKCTTKLAPPKPNDIPNTAKKGRGPGKLTSALRSQPLIMDILHKAKAKKTEISSFLKSKDSIYEIGDEVSTL